MGRNTEVPNSSRDEVLFIPAGMHEESRGGPHKVKGDLTSLREKKRYPRSTGNSRGTLSILPQLHANNEILACTLKEALLCCSVSKQSPRFPRNSKGSSTCFTKLLKFPKIPVATREECCVSHHKSRRAPFSPPQVEMRVVCPALRGKECQRHHHTSRGGWYLLDTGGEPGGFVTIRKPLISPSTRDQA